MDTVSKEEEGVLKFVDLELRAHGQTTDNFKWEKGDFNDSKKVLFWSNHTPWYWINV